MIKTHYPDLFAGEADAPRAAALCAKTRELCDFLVNVIKLDRVPGVFDGTVTYHDSCSGLRELGVKAQPRALLAKVAGLKLDEMNEAEACCGFGGTFSVKFGEISTHIVDRKCDNACATGAKAIVLGDLGCMLNIEGRLRRRGDMSTQVLHVAEVLAGPEKK
jgi:L-lactate dehydrogenase complex protein LldE